MRAVEMHNPLNDVCDRPPVETAGPGEKEAAHSRQGARPAKLVSSGIPVQTISHCRHPISAQIAHPINRRPADPIGGEAFDRWRGAIDRWRGRKLELRGGELEPRGRELEPRGGEPELRAGRSSEPGSAQAERDALAHVLTNPVRGDEIPHHHQGEQ